MRARVTVYDENEHGCIKASFEIGPTEISVTPDEKTYRFEFGFGEHRDFSGYETEKKQKTGGSR